MPEVSPALSFTDKLFPANSINVISFFAAVQWLSVLPAVVKDTASDACNKNRIWLDGASGAVRAVVRQQSAADLKRFLQLRAQELVAGGVLVLMFSGRLDKNRVRSGRNDLADGLEEFQGLNETVGALIQQAFQELVSEGVMDPEKLDTFNIPLYSRSLEEVRSAVKELGQFDIHVLDSIVTPDFPAEQKRLMWPTREALATRSVNSARAVASRLFYDHLGAELSELVFQRYEAILTKNYEKHSYLRMCMNVAILVRRSRMCEEL